MSASTQISTLELPPDCENWLRESGYQSPELHLSSVALLLTLRLAQFPSKFKGLHHDIRHMADFLLNASGNAWVDVPVLILLDIQPLIEASSAEPANQDKNWEQAYRELQLLLLDQGWHEGTFSLHVAPPVRPSARRGQLAAVQDPAPQATQTLPWKGPYSAEEMRKALLGEGPSAELPDSQTETWDSLVADDGYLSTVLEETSRDSSLSAQAKEYVRDLVSVLSAFPKDAGGALKSQLDDWTNRHRPEVPHD